MSIVVYREVESPVVPVGGLETELPFIFAKSDGGALYDPSDFDRYMLDKGPELWGEVPVSVGAAWVDHGDGRYTHASGASTVVTAPLGLRSGSVYEVRFTVTGRTAGSIIPLVGNTGLGSYVAYNGEFCQSIVAAGNGAFYIQPTVDFDGTVSSISIREVLSASSASMFQDANGMVPVTMMEQPVGLLRDRRFGLARGPELSVLAASVSIIEGAWVRQDGNIAVSIVDNGVNIQMSGASRYTYQLIPTKPGAMYVIEAAAEPGASITGHHLVARAGTDSGPVIADTGAVPVTTRALRLNFKATTTTTSVRLVANTATVPANARWAAISIREVPGNHASQTTTPARPKLSARKNLLVLTDEFAAPNWSRGQVTISRAPIPGPHGIPALKLTETTAESDHSTTQGNVLPPGDYTYSVYLKAAERSIVRVHTYSSAAAQSYHNSYIDIATGQVLSGSATMTDVGDGWWRVTLPKTTTSATGSVVVYVYASISAGGSKYTGDGASGIYMAGPQLETGSVATRYQRVTTATDYDHVGFPKYLQGDAVDDRLIFSEVSGAGRPRSIVWAAEADGGVMDGRVMSANTDYAGGGGGSHRYYFPRADLGGGGLNTFVTLQTPLAIAATNDSEVATIRSTKSSPSSLAAANTSAGYTSLLAAPSGSGGFRGKVYGTLLIDRILTEHEMTAALRYFNYKMGAR